MQSYQSICHNNERCENNYHVQSQLELAGSSDHHIFSGIVKKKLINIWEFGQITTNPFFYFAVVPSLKNPD